MMLQSKSYFFLFVFWFTVSGLSALPDQNGTTPSSIINYQEAFVFGLVEGITEFLPISSTGHLILCNEWMIDSRQLSLKQKEAIYAYLIVIQFGAILAVSMLYARKIFSISLGFCGRDPTGLKLGINLLVSFFPAALLGPLLDDLIESFLFGTQPVAWALILGAFLMYLVEKRKRKQDKVQAGTDLQLDDLTPIKSLSIGILQCVAMCPGTSRSMMTIVGGYLVGLSRKQSAEFSFLLGLVTLSAAAVYKSVTMGDAMLQNIHFGPMLIGCLIAGISAALSVRWLVSYLSRRGLLLFVWYRLILGLFVFFYFG